MTMLIDMHWYCSRAALDRMAAVACAGPPHLTPEGKAVLVCNFVGLGSAALYPQGPDGNDVMLTEGRPVTLDPRELPDLERLVEFDHLPEARKATSWLKAGAKLACVALAWLALVPAALAGVAITTAWEVRSGGSDTACSGGFRYGAYHAAPSAPSVSNAGSGGSVAANTYYVVVTYSDLYGETVISGQSSTTTSGSSSTITVTSPAASTGATSWSCYVATTSGGPYFPQGTGLTIGSNRSITSTPPTSGTQPRGVDYSLQDAAQISVADAVANGSTTVTSATAAFTGAVVGNVARINGADYDIISVTNATTIVVDRTITSGSSLALIVGGAFASPGQAGSKLTDAAMKIYIHAGGTFTLANGTTNTAGNSLTSYVDVVGYGTNRVPWNTDTKPVLDAGANSMTMIITPFASTLIANLSLTNSTAKTSVTGLRTDGLNGTVANLSFDHITSPMTFNADACKVVDCYFNACGATGNSGTGAAFVRCVANVATAAPFTSGNSTTYLDDIVINPVAGSFNIAANCTVRNCSVYGPGASGSAIAVTGDRNLFENVVIWGTGAGSVTGFSMNNSTPRNILRNCAIGGCATNYSANLEAHQKVNCITLTADPYTAGGSNDFSLNGTAGGGLACKGAGIPGAFAALSSTTSVVDLGAAQAAAGATGGGFRPRPRTP